MPVRADQTSVLIGVARENTGERGYEFACAEETVLLSGIRNRRQCGIESVEHASRINDQWFTTDLFAEVCEKEQLISDKGTAKRSPRQVLAGFRLDDGKSWFCVECACGHKIRY